MMRRPLLLLALVVGLVAASAVAIALRPTVLGLDLQGGVEVVLQGQPTEQAQVTDESIERSIEIIRSRVDAFGVTEPEIQRQGEDQIIVSLPGVDEPGQVVQDLIKPAQLLLFNFERAVVGSPEGDPSLFAVVKRAQGTEVQSPGGNQPSFYAFDRQTKELRAGPAIDRQTLAETFPNDRIPPGVQVEMVPAGLFIAFQPEALETRGEVEGVGNYILLRYDPKLTGADITEANAVLETGGVGEPRYVVAFQFTDEGEEKFSDVTQDIAQDGQLEGVFHRFAIVLDGEVVTTPTIDFTEYPTGIDGSNGAQIEGNFSQDEAQRLAEQINSGAIPIELKVISQQQVSATLGEESLRQGLIAGAIGLGLVLVFLVGYYRFLGAIAALALVVYGVMLYAVVELVPITLTLPGIAGIILTIGVASDANVVIFERVREEARAGRSPRSAIQNGYRKGITAIIDANVVTLATAVILFLFATAGVKGFAFTLAIGVILSLFTAVVATSAAFGLLARTRFMRDERVMGLNQREIRWKMDFVGRWKLWTAISFVPLAIGAVYIGLNGLNLGLDFESGTRIAITTEQPTDEAAVRGVLAAQGIEGARIQGTTAVVDDRSVDGFQIQAEALTPGQIQQLARAFDAELGLVGNELTEVNSVGPTFGEQVIENALWAIGLSFLVIVLYLTVRFEYKLALPALLSVVHDVGIAVAIYSVTGREVTSATVAALLTIVGYSLYDVVIVFDRIRENVPLLRATPYRQIVNRSVHETLTRSVITSLTTLIPLTVLFFFGGDTLKDFAFALLVGILSGALSSIAIAAPLAALWKEREPEQRRTAVKAERRAARVAGDADIADLDALARAELALSAEFDVPTRRRSAREEEEDEGPEQTFALSAGEPEGKNGEDVEEVEDTEDVEDEEPVPAEARAGTAATPAQSADAEDGGGRATPQTRSLPPAERVRRHRQVQRKRRR